MTGRTHDLAAFTSLNLVAAHQSTLEISLATLLVAIGANLIGGLSPDLDESTSKIWHEIPAGGIIGRVVAPFLGGHRFLSHSLIGVVLFGLASKYLLNLASTVLLVDMNIVWQAFMIGVISHLVMDTFTKEGAPWLLPIPIRFGIPPFRFLRIKTGGLIETLFIFPGLIILNCLIFYKNYSLYLSFLHRL